MFKKILVGVDGSEISNLALAKAVQLAKTNKAQLLLFHAVYLQPIYELAPGVYKTSPSELEAMGNGIIEKAMKTVDLSGVNVVKKTVSDYPTTAILEEIKDGVDLVVLGSRGHGLLAGAMMGSVTQKVTASAPCPVLIVR